MIRMFLFAAAFLGITIGLLVVQPGGNRRTPDVYQMEPVSRAEPTITVAPMPEPIPEQSAPVLAEALPTPVPDVVPAATLPTPATPAEPPSARAPATITARSEPLDDAALRKLTWTVLSSLNEATGRETAPGQPGSLLHTIVRRSLDDGAALSGATPRDRPEISGEYIVQDGETLVSIAQKLYGDINMTGPLFAANQSVLTRPDDLRAGQTLVLPPR